jgi:hypothetical protein
MERLPGAFDRERGGMHRPLGASDQQLGPIEEQAGAFNQDRGAMEHQHGASQQVPGATERPGRASENPAARTPELTPSPDQPLRALSKARCRSARRRRPTRSRQRPPEPRSGDSGLTRFHGWCGLQPNSNREAAAGACLTEVKTVGERTEDIDRDAPCAVLLRRQPAPSPAVLPEPRTTAIEKAAQTVSQQPANLPRGPASPLNT